MGLTEAAIKIYKNVTVYDEALNRIRYLFDEFEEVIVSVSGGKDSTVVFNLALQVAREKGRLPLKVFFLDQEAEWMTVIEYVRTLMYRDDVEPMWYQIPFRMFNATSSTDHWLQAWEPGAEWMRDKEPISIKENKTGCDRFHGMFTAILETEFKDKKTCYLAGVRTEESPSRFVGLTYSAKYKWITWGKILSRKLGHYTFYPIYDWAMSDVWKAIHDNKWEYCPLYDQMYRYGIQPRNMRVSNVHHETAVHSLFYLQEIEGDTWERLTKRIAGIDMAGKMGIDDYFVSKLPPMFTSWCEYRDYLLEKLITNPDWKKKMAARFESNDKKFAVLGDEVPKVHVQSILTNDWECIKIENWERSPRIYAVAKGEASWSKSAK